MKQRFGHGMAIAVAVLFMGVTADAAFVPSAGQTITLTKEFNDGFGGGSFLGHVSGTGSPGTTFKTFCAQLGEVFSPGQNMYVESITNKTVGNTNAGLTLSKGAAWLFEGFAGGTGGFTWNHAGDTAADNQALQKALWHLIGGQQATVTGLAATYVSQAVAHFSGLGQSATDDYLGDRVGILNLRSSSAANANHLQDQLAFNSGGSNSIAGVPEPMSAALWLMGLSGAAFARRRNRNCV